jgi:hypothetical protein
MERIYHTWDKWECYPAGFYETKPPRKDLTTEQCKQMYADFLADSDRFRTAVLGVLMYWPNSCEHYLSNERMNRIAWLGQSAMCFETRVSKYFCGGYFLLSEDQQREADLVALEGLNQWLAKRGEKTLTIEEAASKTQADLY